MQDNSKDQSMTTRFVMLRLTCLVFLGLAAPVQGQVDYNGNDSPWGQRATSGPDAEVPGWFYNLGLTGLRAQLVADQPKALLIKYVFPKTPADGHVEVGDFIIGAGGRMFQEPHRDGYGEKVFGADGPISELESVLEASQRGDGKGGSSGRCVLRVERVWTCRCDLGLGNNPPDHRSRHVHEFVVSHVWGSGV